MKRCAKCECNKSDEEFKIRDKSKGTYCSYCLECSKSSGRKYYLENKDKWANRDPEKLKEIMKRYWNKLKYEVLNAYGGKCVCCDEKEIRFLTIEHGNHDGKEHREQTNQQIYKDLRRRGYPKDLGITVLCSNCNMATRYGEPCPHKLKELNNVSIDNASVGS